MQKSKRTYLGAFLVGVCLGLAPHTTLAKDVYVAQNEQGEDDGHDPGNAHSLAWLNNPVNWGSGPSSVGAGDRVHLCGTFTNQLVLNNVGGADGAFITILLEPNAKFSAPYWRATTGAAIYGKHVSKLVIDGGVNGLIEATDNGMGKKYTNDTSGIYLTVTDNVEVRNISLSALYYRTAGGDHAFAGDGIYVSAATGCTNCSIHNNRIDMVGNAITFDYAGTCSNVVVNNNTATRMKWGCFINSTKAGAGWNFLLYSNRFDQIDAWDGEWSGGAHFHNDGFIINAKDGAATNYNMRIFANFIGPNLGTNLSSAIYVNPDAVYMLPNLMVYNNFLIIGPSSLANNGLITTKVTGAMVANNTFVSTGSGSICVNVGPQNTLMNNLSWNIGQGFMSPRGDATNSDRNVWCPALATGLNVFTRPYSYDQLTWSQWTNWYYPADLHSTTKSPALDASYIPAATDTVARTNGANLSAYFTSDMAGVLRPSTGPWDIGALQSRPDRPSPPSDLRIR
jgi:hypothetical protein